MRILFFGDVVGRSGREGLERHIPCRERLRPDVIVVNAENAAGGAALPQNGEEEFFTRWALVCLTTGNHVWAQREVIRTIDQDPRLLRPLNYPEGTPGHGNYLHILPDGRKILVANVMARLFVEPVLDDPSTLRKSFGQHRLGHTAHAILIDFHGEATSEKGAFGRADGRVSAVVGTHTHTHGGERGIPRGTAFQSDAGMCGDYDSVIGVKELSIWRFVRKMPGERDARRGRRSDGLRRFYRDG